MDDSRAFPDDVTLLSAPVVLRVFPAPFKDNADDWPSMTMLAKFRARLNPQNLMPGVVPDIKHYVL
ncbi:hypothetical protein D3C76_1518330 [compost metagenome]